MPPLRLARVLLDLAVSEKFETSGAENGRLRRWHGEILNPRQKKSSFVGPVTTTISIAWSYWAGSVRLTRSEKNSNSHDRLTDVWAARAKL